MEKMRASKEKGIKEVRKGVGKRKEVRGKIQCSEKVISCFANLTVGISSLQTVYLLLRLRGWLDVQLKCLSILGQEDINLSTSACECSKKRFI